jgi:hypothetical protein
MDFSHTPFLVQFGRQRRRRLPNQNGYESISKSGVRAKGFYEFRFKANGGKVQGSRCRVQGPGIQRAVDPEVKKEFSS